MKKEIISKLEKLEEKLQNLLQENFAYRQKIANFEQILKEQAEQLETLKEKNETLSVEIEQLNVGKAFAGNHANNDEAKKKIDGLIKEINLCITALKE